MPINEYEMKNVLSVGYNIFHFSFFIELEKEKGCENKRIVDYTPFPFPIYFTFLIGIAN